VPTGMNAGVSTSPWGVLNLPARAPEAGSWDSSWNWKAMWGLRRSGEGDRGSPASRRATRPAGCCERSGNRLRARARAGQAAQRRSLTSRGKRCGHSRFRGVAACPARDRAASGAQGRALAVYYLARPGALSFPGRPARAVARRRPQHRSDGGRRYTAGPSPHDRDRVGRWKKWASSLDRVREHTSPERSASARGGMAPRRERRGRRSAAAQRAQVVREGRPRSGAGQVARSHHAFRTRFPASDPQTPRPRSLE